MGNFFAMLFSKKDIESKTKDYLKTKGKITQKFIEDSIDKIKKEEKKISKELKKYDPTKIFQNRIPVELDIRVKNIIKKKLENNPIMSDEVLAQELSKAILEVVEELSLECEEEYKLVKTILSPKYGNGKWPSKQELTNLIENKKFPWLKSQIDQWPEERNITSCRVISSIKDKIMMNNRCIYTSEYPEIKQKCNATCGKGIELRNKTIIKNTNKDFPSFQECQENLPFKEFVCDSGKICKEDCKLEIDINSFSSARCSKPCDSGDGPGEKTYKIKYVSSSKGEPGDKGKCEIDETDKKEGQYYDITVPCNQDKCPACSIITKSPYKNNVVDYTRSVTIQGNNKVYTACLLPKSDGTYEDIDCGGSLGGYNYNKGARSKYNVSYEITKDSYGVQNCTKGKDVVEEACSVNAIGVDSSPLIGNNGKLIKGGGESCGQECVLSDDYPQLVLVDGKECSKECGGGKRRMRKVVKSKSDAPYCPCKNDPSKCPYEEVDCNTQECIAPCEYTDGEETVHKQINDLCPGTVGGKNENVKWDTEKEKWYDPSNKKYYPRNYFMKHMRVPTKKPPIGKGLCYQGNKADRHENCSIDLDGVKRPIDGYFTPWEFKSYIGVNTTLLDMLPKYKNWNDPSNPNSQAKIDSRVQARVINNEKEPITGEVLTENRIRQEENHCVNEESLEFDGYSLPHKSYERKRVLAKYNGKEADEIEAESSKTGKSEGIYKEIPYMKKDGGGYTRYCPIDRILAPGIWEGDGDQIGAAWNEDKCYVEGRQEQGANVRSEKYTVKELEDEAARAFTRDVNLPEYSGTRKGEKRITGRGTRTIYREKNRTPSEVSEKYGGLPTGKWHTVTNGMTTELYDRRTEEYDECDGVKEIIKKIKEKDHSWKANNIYVHQKDCNPVYDWDGKYYITEEAALKTERKNNEEIVTHTDTGRENLSTKSIPGSILSQYMYPGDNMKQTTNGKFLTNYMHPHCQKPGLDSTTAWCGGNSTDDFIQMVTVSGGIEMIKGVVTKGRGDYNQWVKTFEVYVSRNGDSWKQMKDASGSTTFTGNTDQITAKKNYFQNRVEAKYIRFVTKTWEGYNSMRIGYIKDLSGTVDCYGGDGIQQKEPWFRLTFNEAKTRESGGYSEGTHSSTKVCPQNNTILVYQRGGNINTEFNNIKLHNNGKISSDKFLQQEMSELTSNLTNCGTDAIRTGWSSSSSEGSFSWSDCVKPNSDGLATTTKAWNIDDGGFNYMYNNWSSVSENSDYKVWSDNVNYRTDSAHPSTESENGIYKKMPKTFTNKDYHKYNIIRQPCHRGPKGVVPTVGTNWKSTSPYSSEQKTGYMGQIWNLEGGKEGWIDKPQKYTWANGFNGRIKQLTETGNVLNNYKIEERKGTNDNNNNTSWSDVWRGSKSQIGGQNAWHSPYNRDYWNTSLTNDYWTARYKDSNKFIPVGIKIQPKNHNTWKNYGPTQIKFRFHIPVNGNGVTSEGWHWGSTVTLGPFSSKDDIKTILIEPTERLKYKDCDKFYVYARHGRGIKYVAFRINYLVGIPGVSVEKKWSSISPADPVDCSIGDWGDWGACGASCGGGKKSRSRTISSASNGGRSDCTGDIQEETDCNTHVCPVDCIGKWNDWEYDGNNSVSNVKEESKDEHGCNYKRTCYDGYIRTYTHQQSKKGSGKDCPHKKGATQLKVGGWVCGSWKKGNCFIDTSGDEGSCIGSNTVIFTDKGYLKLKDIKVGDKVKNIYGQWSEVYYVRNHGFNKIEHLQIEFEDNVKINLTKEHLLYSSSGERIRADSLKIGDYVLGQQKIVNIRKIMDIPLTPCIIDGSLNIGNKIISCWSHNEENAKKMDKISIMAKKILDSGTTVFELSEIAHNFYNQYHSGKKDLSIMKNLVSDYLNKKSLETINVK